MRDAPYSENMGHAYVDGRWRLTHVVWHPTTLAGVGNCPETGVRDIESLDAQGRPRFELIQHGWFDFKKAEEVIIKGLRKGWSTSRISDFMDKLRQSRRIR